MTALNTVTAELRKTATLPATAVAFAVAVLGPVAVAAINAVGVRNALLAGQPEQVADTSAAQAALAAVPLGTVGAVVLGVTAISSEYTATGQDAGGGRQLSATLAATPRRTAVLAAKALAVALLVVAAAAVALPASWALARAIIGAAAPAGPDPDHLLARSLGAAVYWTLTAFIALAITVLTRSGVVPLLVLIVNSSVVSFSFLLSRVTPLALYLPDLAGIRLFAEPDLPAYDALEPLAGGLVMAGWAAGLLAVVAVVFTRRDA